MYLIKTKNEKGEVSYVEITFEEAVKHKRNEIVFTTEEDEDKYDDYFDEHEESKGNKKWTDNPFTKEFYTQIFDETFKTKMKGIGEKIRNSINESRKKEEEPINENRSRLLKMLPFMNEDDVSEIVKDIIDNPSKYKDVKLEDFFPFLSEEDSSKLFVAMINDPELSKGMDIKKIAPFVEEDCLDVFVDHYIKGEMQDVNIDALYPFLSDKSIKKLFKYLSSKDN